MRKDTVTDFHRSWMIEVTSLESGFQSVCCSSVGNQLSDRKVYTCQSAAWKAAVDLIDRFYACYAIDLVLRDVYEAGQLRFEEWQMLSQSLGRIPQRL